MLRRTPAVEVDRVNRAVAALGLPDAVWPTSPWQPRSLVASGLGQWLRCCGAAPRDGQVIGMPSHAVDEAWRGFILCTARYADSCAAAYVRFVHHRPDGAGSRRAGVEQPWGVPAGQVDVVLAEAAGRAPAGLPR